MNAWFARFSRKERLTDLILREAIERAERGLVDADFGGGLIKQRIARAGGGRSGGYRSIIAFRSGDRAVFLYGFAKNVRADISPDEEKVFKAAAKELMKLTNETIADLIQRNVLIEVQRND